MAHPIGVAMEATPIALGGTTLIEDVVPFSRELLVEETSGATVGIQRVSGTQLDGDTHQQELLELIEVPDLPPEEKTCLLDLIAELHGAFSLSMEDRGETDLVQFEIDTGSASPRRQSPRRMPFLVRQEVTSMQATGIIQPSKSPWASPIVLVQKKDGSHRFCVDYRELNSVTKKDTFPLPRIDDLLDQLGRAKYFSTLDLASGFWQIRVHPDSVEKTAFVVPQGLYEFNVMPFGLCNAPSVSQRLMQQVMMGLNHLDGPDFVSVYIDDVLVFSETLNDHLEPIPVQRPFQILGVDVMDLPKTELGNQHVLVFQDFLTKWPLVFPIPDQKTSRIVKLFVEEVVLQKPYFLTEEQISCLT